LVGFNGANATIENLGLVDSTVQGIGQPSGSSLGGLVGFEAGTTTTLTNVYADNVSVTASNVLNNIVVGGLVGWNVQGSLSDAYWAGSISVSGGGTPQAIGGLAGENQGGSISNAYAVGSISYSGGTSRIGGLVGFNTQITNNSSAVTSISNVYA